MARDTDQKNNLWSLIEDAMQQHSGKTAVIEGNTQFSFSEIQQHTVYLAGALSDLSRGKKRQRIALMLPNVPEFFSAFFAIIRSGNIVVNINPRYTPHELEHILKDSGAAALMIHRECLPTLVQACSLDDFHDLKNIILVGDGDKTAPASLPYETASYGQLLSKKLTPVAGDRCANRTVLLQYTGGTTGKAKAAQLTEANLYSVIHQAISRLAPRLNLDDNNNVLTILPLYHVFALVTNFLSMFTLGITNILIRDPQDGAAIIGALKSRPVTVLTGVDTLLRGLAENPVFQKMDHQFRIVISGGMAAQKSTCEAWEKVTGCPVLQGYGMTETSSLISFASFWTKSFDGSVGTPLHGTKIEIRDITGKRLPPLKDGEILVKGPQVMPGYWNHSNEGVFSDDGFLHTGDIGYFDEQGRLYIKDRQKDLIIVSGFNVFPTEIESAVEDFPGIQSCACVGLPDAKTGERVCLAIVLSPDGKRPSKEEITSYLKSRLAAYKTPKTLRFFDTLPLTQVGKVDKPKLKEMF